MNSSEVKITAQPITNNSCKFSVSVPVYPEAAFYFGTREVGDASPLARRLFAIEGVTSVLVSHNEITVNKGTMAEWPVIGRQIGSAIREFIASGEPAISDEMRKSLPSSDEIRQRVLDVLETEINPAVASHGGFVNLIDVQDNNIFIQMGGGCQGCGQANVTLKQGVEVAIRAAVPGVGGIFDTTDHASGRNPYYARAGH